MTPAEGCAFFGIPNCCRVVMGNHPQPPFDAESDALAGLKQVVWSAVGSCGSVRNNVAGGDLAEVIRQARRCPNITGAVLDDFLNSDRMALFPPEAIREFKRQLATDAGRALDLWVVWYDHQLQDPVDEHLAVCDVITFWTWDAADLAHLRRNLDEMIRRTPGKRRLAGCYMWDYGAAQPMPDEWMTRQLDIYREYIHKGELEGMVLCSNCIADIGLSAVERTQEWLARHGSESIGRKTE